MKDSGRKATNTVSWRAFDTDQFQEDVFHFNVPGSRLSVWKGNIERHPLIGTPVEGMQGVGAFDYSVEGYVIRYLLSVERRHVIFMTLREKMEESALPLVGVAWKLLVDIATIWGAAR